MNIWQVAVVVVGAGALLWSKPIFGILAIVIGGVALYVIKKTTNLF